ncbi:Cysteine--tRNA ligase [Dirofilaria immitis]
MFVINKSDTNMDIKLRNITTIDEEICQEASSRASPMTSSISIRNKGEFEFVKMLYKHFDQAGRALPLLIGLTYINNLSD